MAMFLCGGSDLLDNKVVKAKANTDVVYKATNDGYEGYEQVTVSHFATLGVKQIQHNGVASVISNDDLNSYTAVNVEVRVDDNYYPIWNSSDSGQSPATKYNQVIITNPYNANTLYDWGYRYLEFIGYTDVWVLSRDGTSTDEHQSTLPQTARVLVPLKEYGLHNIGFLQNVPGLGICYANMPINIVSATSIILCPSDLVADTTGVPHLSPSGKILEVRAIR